MSKFTFIVEDDPMPFSESVVSKRTVEFDAAFLDDVVAEFELFLRGAGFNPTGKLGFYEEMPEFEFTEEQAEQLAKQHSDFYYDTERNK